MTDLQLVYLISVALNLAAMLYWYLEYRTLKQHYAKQQQEMRRLKRSTPAILKIENQALREWLDRCNCGSWQQ